ncbi:hypothetical protein FKM82_024388 [Ascaphus truei]
MQTAELPGALWREGTDPGEWGSERIVLSEDKHEKSAGQCIDREAKRRSPRLVTPNKEPADPSDEDPRESTRAVIRPVVIPCEGNGRKAPLTGISGERSRVSPVERKVERRSPSHPGTGGSSGDGRSTPNQRSGKTSPSAYLAPIKIVAEERPCQAQAVHVQAAELPDVVVEEEIPHGDPSQDGGVSGSGDDVTSGGGSGATGRRASTLRRSGGGSQSPVKAKSWQAARKAEKGETSSADRPHSDSGLSEGRERVGTPRIPIAHPYAQLHALANAPVPVTFSCGSTSSLSEGSQGTGEERTGERLGSYASEGGTRGGGQLGKVSESRWVPKVAIVQLEESSKQERWSNPPHSIGTSGISSWGDTEEGDSLEWGSEGLQETRWWAPLFEGYVRWMDHTRFLLQKEDVVDYWWAVGEFYTGPEEEGDAGKVDPDVSII